MVELLAPQASGEVGLSPIATAFKELSLRGLPDASSSSGILDAKPCCTPRSYTPLEPVPKADLRAAAQPAFALGSIAPPAGPAYPLSMTVMPRPPPKPPTKSAGDQSRTVASLVLSEHDIILLLFLCMLFGYQPGLTLLGIMLFIPPYTSVGAVRGSRSPLIEDSHLDPKYLVRRELCYQLFLIWCSEYLDTPSSTILLSGPIVVEALRAYGHYLHDTPQALYLYTHAVVGFMHFSPEMRIHIRSAWKVIRQWQHDEPGRSRVSLPRSVFQALVCLALLWGWVEFAGLMLRCWVACSSHQMFTVLSVPTWCCRVIGWKSLDRHLL